MSLGNHLCSQKDVVLAAAKSAHDLFMGKFPCRRILIHPQGTDAFAEGPETLFCLFRSRSKKTDPFAPAFGTDLRYRFCVTAVMTDKLCLFGMIHKGDGTIGTLD